MLVCVLAQCGLLARFFTMGFSLDRVDSFFRNIGEDDKVAIVHDVDPDGILSAVILARTIQKLRGRPPELVEPFNREGYSIPDALVERMRDQRITVLITTDFGLDQNLPLVEELAKSFRILILDHHTLYNDINAITPLNERVTVVKPQLFSDVEPSRYCSAKLAFDCAMRVVDATGEDWLAAAASIADVATEPWHEFLDQTFKKYDAAKKDDLFETKLGRVAAIINSALVVDPDRVHECFDTAFQATGPEDVLNSRLAECKEVIDRELEVWLQKFTKCESYNDLYLFMIEPKYNIKSTLSTVLGLKYPHRTILVMDVADGFVSVSARRGDQKIAVNGLLEKAIKGFDNANAGGHVPAAGARFPEKYLDEFKKRVVDLHE